MGYPLNIGACVHEICHQQTEIPTRRLATLFKDNQDGVRGDVPGPRLTHISFRGYFRYVKDLIKRYCILEKVVYLQNVCLRYMRCQ